MRALLFATYWRTTLTPRRRSYRCSLSRSPPQSLTGGWHVLCHQPLVSLLVRLRLDPPERLSAREREVLGPISEGRTNAGLAAHLFISEAAVNKHIGDIFNKLGPLRMGAGFGGGDEKGGPGLGVDG